jgi:glyoxylase-like metal-dependent hydrolase (beta-lactamase superfamily II)
MGAKIYAHEIETPYIQGDKTPVKLAKMEENAGDLPADRMGFYKMLKNAFPTLYVHVDEQVKDEQELPFCGGIIVYHTPGHTPGHIALLHKESNTLIAGDAANISDGKLVGSNPIHTDNAEQAAASLEKIKSLGAKMIICYHSGTLTL